MLFGLLLLVAMIAPTPAPAARAASQSPVELWPAVIHQGGAFAVLPSDLPTFTGSGLTLALTNHIPPEGTADIAGGAVRYIDPRVTNLLSQHLGKYHCGTSSAPCPISPADRQAFLDAVQRELTKQHDNPKVVGYDILDDYMGNVPRLLADVNSLIAADNQSLPVPRATICGFGGTLDYHKPGLPDGTFVRDFASLQHFEKRELLNFSPAACDMVTLYIYSLGHHAPLSDYSMSALLPVMLGDLRAHGWNQAQTPLLGSPQTWEGTPPTAAQVREQTAAFCSSGAVSIVAFSWHNFPSSGPNAEPELANSNDMRAGLSAGVQDCQQIWTAGHA